MRFFELFRVPCSIGLIIISKKWLCLWRAAWRISTRRRSTRKRTARCTAFSCSALSLSFFFCFWLSLKSFCESSKWEFFTHLQNINSFFFVLFIIELNFYCVLFFSRIKIRNKKQNLLLFFGFGFIWRKLRKFVKISHRCYLFFLSFFCLLNSQRIFCLMFKVFVNGIQ